MVGNTLYTVMWAMMIQFVGYPGKNGLIYKLLANVVKGDQTAPFSIASTPRCRGGRYSIPWIAPLYPWYVPCNAEC